MRLPWKKETKKETKQAVIEGPRLEITGPDGERTVPIGGQEISIGRLDGNDILLSDRSVTSRHARLLWNGDGYSVEDIGSNTGTYLNGVRLSGAHPLKSGDEVRIGASRLRLVL